MVIAVPIGYLSVRRTGIYFAMVTLAFAQMIYFVANQWRDLTGSENGLQGIPRNFFGIELIETDSFYFYYAGLVFILIGMFIAWRVVNSPFGRVLVAIRDNPARARALGYDVNRYKIVVVFVISAGLAGLAGGVFAISHGFASLQELNWTTSGKVVLITVLGGIGTLWGGPVGAAIVVQLEDWLASSGLKATGSSSAGSSSSSSCSSGTASGAPDARWSSGSSDADAGAASPRTRGRPEFVVASQGGHETSRRRPPRNGRARPRPTAPGWAAPSPTGRPTPWGTHRPRRLRGGLPVGGADPTGGYADDVLAGIKVTQPKTTLVNLACPGERSTTMVRRDVHVRRGQPARPGAGVPPRPRPVHPEWSRSRSAPTTCSGA